MPTAGIWSFPDQALGEPIINRRQKFARLVAPSLVAPQSRKARGAAQFPGERALPARPVERLLELTLGRRCGSRRTLQQKKLALDPKQLGSCPAFFAPLGADDRLLDRGK